MTGLRVGEVMTRYVEFADPEMTVQEAAVLMGDLDVGCLPVGKQSGIEGVVTDRDILYRLVAAGLDPSLKLRRVMSEPVISCGENDTVQAVLDAMASHHIRRMPVMNEAGAIVGWITLSDLSRKLLVENGTLQEALRSLTEAEQV